MMVSIVIPTYKGCSQLIRAIDSVLNQTYRQIEVIVVDDNSPGSDERHKTEELMTRYATDERVWYLKHPKNLNGAAARNTGIFVAKGEYISFLDDDDYYLPERIEKSVNFFQKNKDAVGVYVGVDVVDENGIVSLRVRPNCDLQIADILQNEMIIGTGSNIFIKSDIANKIGGFDECFVRRQDIEFMIRVCHEGRVGYISEKLIVKSGNGTLNYPTYAKMKIVLDQFSNKFRNEIDSLGDKKKKFYAMQYRSLLSIARYERNIEGIKESVQLIKQYDKLTLKEKLKNFIYINNLRDNAIVEHLVRIRRIIKSRL